MFAGSIPEIYEGYLVPLIFKPYAQDIASRVASHTPRNVLEIAAGTGVVTRRLAAVLPTAAISATDLNQPMLDHAAAIGTSRPVEWRRADAMELPFGDATFDAVVCQFGVMFFADKQRAFAEARRVLRPGGHLFFNAWDRIEDNEFANLVTNALAEHFSDGPPRFLARVPHGYHDTSVIAHDLALAGFSNPAKVATVAAQSRAESANVPAVAYCQGTPLRNEIEARGSHRLIEATNAVRAHLTRRFGARRIVGRIQAHVVVAQK